MLFTSHRTIAFMIEKVNFKGTQQKTGMQMDVPISIYLQWIEKRHKSNDKL